MQRSSKTTYRTLFGNSGSAHPWRSEDFRAVDDRIRGGSSTSHLVAERIDKERWIGHFFGHLDTSTLGGAGFASQACTRDLDLEGYDGIRVELLQDTNTTHDAEKRQPTDFTLNFKTEMPQKRPDGRNQSVLVYEYDFSSVDKSERDDDANLGADQDVEKQSTSIAEHTLVHRARWSEFKPTYRGRPVRKDDPMWRPFTPASIKEISIMCRSNFDKQSGDFDLKLLSIQAFRVGDAADGRRLNLVQRLWHYLQRWFWAMATWSRRQEGHVKL